MAARSLTCIRAMRDPRLAGWLCGRETISCLPLVRAATGNVLTRLLPLPLPHGSGSKWSVIASTLLAITPQPRPDGATSASGRNGLIEGERLQAPPHRLRVQSFPEPLLVGWIISRGWWLSYDDPRSEPRKGGHWLAAPSQRRHAAEKKHGGASKRLAGRMKYDGQRNQLHKYGRAVERFSCVHRFESGAAAAAARDHASSATCSPYVTSAAFATSDHSTFATGTTTRCASGLPIFSIDRDRGVPLGAAPPTPPGIRVAYLGGSTRLSFNLQCRREAGRESRRRDCAAPF